MLLLDLPRRPGRGAMASAALKSLIGAPGGGGGGQALLFSHKFPDLTPLEITILVRCHSQFGVNAQATDPQAEFPSKDVQTIAIQTCLSRHVARRWCST